MGNALAMQPSQIIIEEDDPLLRDYKKATVKDYAVAKENFDALQATVGDKMAITLDEFDDIFSLICQDPAEHFELFDCWDLGKVDVMEVFAVVIVYCKARIEIKIPLLFALFDFDHSGEISESELVLLLLCATRGLCKAIGLDRPPTNELEALATSAFQSIDRDHNGAISLQEFTDWALDEPSLLLYIRRFAATRLIYTNQLEYDTLLAQLCQSFVECAAAAAANQTVDAAKEEQQQQPSLTCTAAACKEIIERHCPSTEEHELEYLVRAMVDTMHQRRQSSAAATMTTTNDYTDALLLHQPVALDVFCLIVASYAAFVVADDDQQHKLDVHELLVLLWLVRGIEPSPQLVERYMTSLDHDSDHMLSALEWVTFSVENDARTGSRLTFATQLHLLFTHADRNGDAALSLQELRAGLKSIVLQALVNEEAVAVGGRLGAATPPATAFAAQLATHADAIDGLVGGLANELLVTLDTNASNCIEWVEFRQHVDVVEARIAQMKTYIKDVVLT